MNDRACSKVISRPLTSGNDWPMTLHVWGTCFNGTLTGIRWDSDQMQDLAKNRVEVCKLGEFLRLVHFVAMHGNKIQSEVSYVAFRLPELMQANPSIGPVRVEEFSHQRAKVQRVWSFRTTMFSFVLLSKSWCTQIPYNF